MARVTPLTSKPKNHGRLQGYSQLKYYGNCHFGWQRLYSGNKCGVAAVFTLWRYKNGVDISEQTFKDFDDWLSFVNGNGPNFGLLGTDGEGIKTMLRNISGNTYNVFAIDGDNGHHESAFYKMLDQLSQGILCLLCLDWHTNPPSGHWAVAYAHDEHKVYIANDREVANSKSYTWETEGRPKDEVMSYMAGTVVTLAGMDAAFFSAPKA